MKPLVSVVIPTHNSEKTIIQTLNSVELQDFDLSSVEVVIVDDASTDSTLKVIAEATVSFNFDISVYSLNENVGVAKARNYGISKSSGEFIAFLDSDDVWLPNKLASQLTFMNENQVGFSFTNYDVINVLGEVVGSRKMRPGKYNLRDFLEGNPAGLLTVIIRKNVITRNLFPDIHHEDYAAWLFLLTQNPNLSAWLIDQNTAQYRVHPSVSSNKFKAFIWTVTVLRSYGGLSGFKLIRSIVKYGLNVVRRSR
ncbi:glycosyltransferase family 2 protein [Weissella confusa]|uniref:glycosyltransferase family 2 protein n=1 Tax=Weissella confusa TaxID=1583 RepID=UPI0002465E26|nr:glycosyltransferase family 2 protein [Weissella confusa]MBJ7616511.1 glycosyltransferase family 2 protein [Weissella confusa]MBJ7626435.1 glycosyltransferase family 2 protein [Weissella confusa]MCT8392501.1 glycosyltransferase family 2 protein [Weissella confusa]CCF31658.1 Glycosyl transferase, group 2 [Weissella confusa LBAE C39-2]